MLFYIFLVAVGFVVGVLVGRVNPSLAAAVAKAANAAKQSATDATKKL